MNNIKGSQWGKWLQVAAEKEGDVRGKEEREGILENLKRVLISYKSMTSTVGEILRILKTNSSHQSRSYSLPIQFPTGTLTSIFLSRMSTSSTTL
jgi:hypothetical protein